MTPLSLLPKVRSQVLMDAMELLPCTLRIASLAPGMSCAPEDTVVGCHLPVGQAGGKGVATKVTELAVAAGCRHCHNILDRVDQKSWSYIYKNFPHILHLRMLHGLVETHARLYEMGIITVKGDMNNER